MASSPPEANLLSGRTTNYGTMGPEVSATALADSPVRKKGLHRGLSARQVQMIAIAGTIGTGLFLGTGRSLAQGGPASMLICYAIVGFIVYVTLLLLGEMATQYPVAGRFFMYQLWLGHLCYFEPLHFLFSLILMAKLPSYTTPSISTL